jgi:hypothetical protein
LLIVDCKQSIVNAHKKHQLFTRFMAASRPLKEQKSEMLESGKFEA